LRAGVSLAFAAAVAASSSAAADPVLADPSMGTLELVTPEPSQQASLPRIDGLAFDEFGNLFGALEVSGATGGVVYIDKQTGDVVTLVEEIGRADQIALHPSGDLFVTSELKPASTSDRIYRVAVAYDASQRPMATGTTATTLTTSVGIADAEGLVVLEAAGAYGSVGELYVCEDETPGRVFHVDPLTGLLDELAAGLAAPEGLAFGDFGGAQAPALYAAESKANRIVRLLPDGSVTAVGNPSQVSMTLPDNVEFGPDGFLYVAEDRDAPDARILRIAPDGRHTVVATGFDASQGMAFDLTSGDLYISEQNANRVWRLRFARTAMPGLVGWTPVLLVAALVLSAALVLAKRRRAPSP
jgi:sugar lactone lactonase YvrE